MTEGILSAAPLRELRREILEMGRRAGDAGWRPQRGPTSSPRCVAQWKPAWAQLFLLPRPRVAPRMSPLEMTFGWLKSLCARHPERAEKWL